MEPQRNMNNQSNFEQEEQSSRSLVPGLLQYQYDISMKNRHIDK
jgi:hypothetical protein